jgi:NAD(P)-dependent dehydrogenase (short-subunit alcohol dehydrogenase family)
MDDMKAVAEGALAFFDGRVDSVIHCGGITWSGPLLVDADERFDTQLHTNVRSFWTLMRGLVPAMRAHGGSVTVISSVHGHRAEGSCTLYTACKAALMAMAVELSGEFGADDIRVNSVSPGWILAPTPSRSWITFFIRPEHQEAVRALTRELDEEVILHTQTLPRLGRPEDVAFACLYLASDAARFITGTDLLVDGGKLHMQPDSVPGMDKFAKRVEAREKIRAIARGLPPEWWKGDGRPNWHK